MKILRCLVGLALMMHSGYAWGPEGHEIVAKIATQFMSDSAKRHVAFITGSDVNQLDLAALANWADKIRPTRPETASWHFVDIPLNQPTYNAARDCADDDCVVAQ